MALSYVTVQLHVNHREGMSSKAVMADTVRELNRALDSLRGQGEVVILSPIVTDGQSVERITPRGPLSKP